MKIEKPIAVLHIESGEDEQNVYFSGDFTEVTIAIVGAMQAAPDLAKILNDAVTAYRIADIKNLNLPTNIQRSEGDEASQKREEFMNEKKGGV